MRLRRTRFADVIERQLGLFASEHADLVREAEMLLARYDSAGRDEAEGRYGDYLDAVDTGTELLADLRDGFAATLEGAAAERYVAEFNRTASRRLPEFALELESR